MVARIERSKIRDGERRAWSRISLRPTRYALRVHWRELLVAAALRIWRICGRQLSPSVFLNTLQYHRPSKYPLFGHLVPARDCADASEIAAAVTIATDTAKRQILVMTRVLLKLGARVARTPTVAGRFRCRCMSDIQSGGVPSYSKVLEGVAGVVQW